jgi:hypothetical protein
LPAVPPVPGSGPHRVRGAGTRLPCRPADHRRRAGHRHRDIARDAAGGLATAPTADLHRSAGRHPGPCAERRRRGQRVLCQWRSGHQPGGVDGRQRARHPHGRHDRGRQEHHRYRRCRPQREAGRHQGRQRRRVLLPRGRGVRVRVGRHAPHQHHEQQLLRRPVAVQLPQRRGAAGDLGSGAAGNRVRPVPGHAGGRGRRQPVRRPGAPDRGRHQPGRYDAGDTGHHERLRGGSGRGAGGLSAWVRPASCGRSRSIPPTASR